jgi:hypothetical protein
LGKVIYLILNLQTYYLKFNRSVHNIRIERLWRDLTLGFGEKWKSFFYLLEFHHELDHNSDSHIWLLHHLFLPSIHCDALQWAESWNTHVLSIRGERQRSPKDMFVFGMIQNGMRGLSEFDEDLEDEDIQDIDSYGIDWMDYHDDTLIAHHDAENRPDLADPVDSAETNPFRAHHPHHLSHIKVEKPNCPFSPRQLLLFQHRLEQLSCFGTNVMDGRRLLWISALQICNDIYSTSQE